MGDSLTRQLFWTTARKLNQSLVEPLELRVDRHADISFRSHDVLLEFQWDPYLNMSISDHAQAQYMNRNEDQGSRQQVVIISAGLWHARHLGGMALKNLEQDVELTLQSLAAVGDIVILPIPIPAFELLNVERSAAFTPEVITALNQAIIAIAVEHNIPIFQTKTEMLQDNVDAFKEDGLHLQEYILSTQADILLNYICRDVSRRIATSATACCRIPESPTVLQASLLLLITCCFTYWVIEILSSKLVERPKIGKRRAENPMTRNLGTISLVVVYCYISDRTQILEHSARIIDEFSFKIIVGCCLAAGILSTAMFSRNGTINAGLLSPSSVDTFLSREQTEEWKGWMQLVILLYHFFGLSKVLWTYQLARCLVSAYLFMIGYGHTLYFLRSRDFSCRRLFSVLLRLNLLPSLLAFAMDNNYDHYYFSGLASFWFLVIWMTLLGITTEENMPRQVCYRVATSFLLVCGLIKTPNLMLAVPKTFAHTGILEIDAHEFSFRVGLDAVIPYAGILVATLKFLTEKNEDMASGLTKVCQRFITQRFIVPLVALSAGILIWSFGAFCGLFENKYSYNRWHPLVSPVPILAFVVLRNLTPALRRKHSKIFARIGKCSLETFVLQYHIWLAADAKGLLRLGLFDIERFSGGSTVSSQCFWYETILISVIFLWCSEAVSNATSRLVGHFTADPSQDNKEMSVRGCRVDQFNDSVQRKRYTFQIILFLSALWTLNLAWRATEWMFPS